MLADQYVVSRYRRGEIGRGTAKTHRVVLHSVTATYGDRPVKNFRAIHVDRWLQSCEHLTASTRRAYFSVARGFTGWLAKHGHIKTDPMREMRPPRKPRSVPRAMPETEVADLLDHAPDARARAVVALAVGCGLRCIEISRAHAEDVDWAGRSIRVVGKFSNEREVSVPDMVRDHLRSYLAEDPVTVGPLIRSYVQPWKPLSAGYISALVSLWMSQSGVKLGPRDGHGAHSLRHTAATDVLSNCGDIRVVKEMLGHENIATTSIYLKHADLPMMRSAMEGRSYRRTQ